MFVCVIDSSSKQQPAARWRVAERAGCSSQEQGCAWLFLLLPACMRTCTCACVYACCRARGHTCMRVCVHSCMWRDVGYIGVDCACARIHWCKRDCARAHVCAHAHANAVRATTFALSAPAASCVATGNFVEQASTYQNKGNVLTEANLFFLRLLLLFFGIRGCKTQHARTGTCF